MASGETALQGLRGLCALHLLKFSINILDKQFQKGSFVKMAGGETALQGLRGLSALHLLLYHSLSRTKWPQGWLVDLQVDIRLRTTNFPHIFFDGS